MSEANSLELKDPTWVFREMLDDAPMGVFAVDQAGNFIYLNQTIVRLVGSPDAKHSAQYNAFKLPTIKQVGLDVAIRRGLQGETVEAEFDYVSMFGKPLPAAITVKPLRDSSGRVLAAMAYVELRATQQRVEQLQTNLQEAFEAARLEVRELDRLRSHFSALVSHELRTPLQPLCGYLQMLDEDRLGPLTVGQKDALAVARRSAARVAELVDRIVDASRPGDRSRAVQLEVIDPVAIVKSTMHRVASVASAKEVDIQFEADDNLPEIVGNPDKLHQAVTALIDNACAFVDRGGSIGLVVRRHPGGGVSMLFANTGVSIEVRDRATIFEPFVQIDEPGTGLHRGLGLGLSIVREVALFHSGSVHFTEAEGYATAFELILPARPLTMGGSEGEMGGRSKPLALVADPDDRRRAQIVNVLDDTGFSSMVLDSQDVLNVLKRGAPSVVVMSMEHGAQLLLSLRTHARPGILPIFLCTATQDPAAKRAALDAGATAVLEGELDLDWLQRLLRSVYPNHLT